MDVDDTRFWPLMLPIFKAISKAEFVAIDAEFSGISMKGFGPIDRAARAGKPTLQKHYEETKQAAEKYTLLQFGITCIEKDRERGMYVARPYNFNVTPLFIHGDKLEITRDVTFSSSSMQFLLKNSFDIGALFTKGVPYLSREDEESARLNYLKKQENFSAIPDLVIPATSTSDLEFYDKARKTISQLCNQDKIEMEFVIVGLPGGLNGFQRRLVYQLVRNEFPNYRAFSRNGGECMQIEILDSLKEAQVKKSKMKSFESNLAKQRGLQFIFEALAGGDLNDLDLRWFMKDTDGEPAFIDLEATKVEIQEIQKALKSNSRIIVGHNLFVDLIFIYKTFVGTLPERVTDFQQRIHGLFPQVIDTKYLATCGCNSLKSNSSLQELCDSLKTRLDPKVYLAEKHGGYGEGSKAHEAGYDSWMTALVLIKLSAKLLAEQNHRDHQDISNASNAVEQTLKTNINEGVGMSNCKDTSKTMQQKLEERIGPLFIDENIFNILNVEGVNDSDSHLSSSPDGNDGGVSLSGDDQSQEASLMDLDVDESFRAASRYQAPEVSLIDADIDGDFRIAFRHQAFLRPVSAEHSSFNGNGLEMISDGPSPDWLAAQPNTHSPLKQPSAAPKNQNGGDMWIPGPENTFWDVYINRLRVYAIEGEVCCLT